MFPRIEGYAEHTGRVQDRKKNNFRNKQVKTIRISIQTTNKSTRYNKKYAKS